MEADEYFTVRYSCQVEIRVKGSRFIALLAPVGTEKEAKDFLQRIARRYHDASHQCFAYRVGAGQSAVVRFSDAGEPSGTAGRPILESIMGRNLSDVVVVVVRYFGGIKLGTGGLARAYRECAGRALDGATRVGKVLTREFELRFPYELTTEIDGVARRHDVQIVAKDYGQDVFWKVVVRRNRAQTFTEKIKNVGKGRVDIEML
jgi:uncharacterized YigZ family protein